MFSFIAVAGQVRFIKNKLPVCFGAYLSRIPFPIREHNEIEINEML
jgi:hypothetical protein